MSNTFLFFRKFLRYGTKIASAVPSSRWLSDKTVSNVDWDRTKTIVELGAGTGPVTKLIVERAHVDCKVFIFESDKDFVSILKKDFSVHKNVEIIEGDACAFGDILFKHGIQSVDYIISGLPTPSLLLKDRERLFENVRKLLSPEGTFNQITEMPLVYLRLYKRYFNNVKFIFEPRNFPPGGVYLCRSPK